jgi:hypothetical protein
LNNSTTRELFGCTTDLRDDDGTVHVSLAEERLDRPHTGAAVLPCPGGLAEGGEGGRARLDGGRDRAVVDDLAMAQDHGGPRLLRKVRLT